MVIREKKLIELSKKQKEAWDYLNDTTSNIILYGGKAYSGKSFLASFWLISNCLKYNNTRWALCRKSLTDLKKTSLKTFKETAINFFNLKENKDFKINHQSNTITFLDKDRNSENFGKFEGSEIMLLNLDFRPSDAEGHFLGGYEFTGAVIDELPQITQTYFNVLFSRLRFMIDENNISAKLFCTCNPSVGWVKSYFYDRWKKDNLPNDIKFVSTVGDVLFFRKKTYENTLKTFSERELKRLEYGDWEYASAEDQIFQNNKLEDIFTGLDYGLKKNERDEIINDFYISADIARFGEDKSVIILWNGMKIIQIEILSKSDITNTAKIIFDLQNKLKIPRHKVIVDSDGVGGGVMDILKCKGFINNAKPFKDEKYDMLKSQCYYKLSKELWSVDKTITATIKDAIKRELQAIRDASDDFKYKVNTKDEQKKLLGNSPDYADAIMMRMYFTYQVFDKIIDFY